MRRIASTSWVMQVEVKCGQNYVDHKAMLITTEAGPLNTIFYSADRSRGFHAICGARAVPKTSTSHMDYHFQSVSRASPANNQIFGSNEQTWTPSEVCAVIVTPTACFGTGFLVAQQCKHGEFFCWKKCAMILSHPKSPCNFFIFYLRNSVRNVPQLFFRKIANAAFVVPNLHERDSR